MLDRCLALLALASLTCLSACAGQGEPSPMAKPAAAATAPDPAEIGPDALARYEEDLAAFEQQLSGCAALQRLSASNPTVKLPPDCADEHLSATCAKLRDSHVAHPALRLPASCAPYLDGS